MKKSGAKRSGLFLSCFSGSGHDNLRTIHDAVIGELPVAQEVITDICAGKLMPVRGEENSFRPGSIASAGFVLHTAYLDVHLIPVAESGGIRDGSVFIEAFAFVLRFFVQVLHDALDLCFGDADDRFIGEFDILLILRLGNADKDVAFVAQVELTAVVLGTPVRKVQDTVHLCTVIGVALFTYDFADLAADVLAGIFQGHKGFLTDFKFVCHDSKVIFLVYKHFVYLLQIKISM